MVTEITSLHNPRVKQWQQLLDKKGRDRLNKFIVEGTHLVQEALQAKVHIECIVYSLDRGIPMELKEMGASSSLEWIGVSEAVLVKCTDTFTPQAVFAIVHKLQWDVQTLLDQENSLVVVIDGIQDPGNLGTIIRSADAVQAAGVLIGKGSVDLYNLKTVRATMGSLFHVPLVEGDLRQMLPLARQQSIQIIHTSLQAQRSCYDLNFNQATWFVVGNEAQGVSGEVLPFIDHSVIIPMHGQTESLNVAMAATVLLYEALRQRHYRK